MQALTLFLSALACADGLLVGSSISGLSGAPLRAHAVTMATEQASALSSSATSIAAERYVATNRFRVKEGREAAFEKRWADRQSRLGLLDGFRFFCMMRRVEGKVSCTPQHATHRDAGPIFFTYLLTYSPTHLLTYVPTYLLTHSLASSTPHTAIFRLFPALSLTRSLGTGAGRGRHQLHLVYGVGRQAQLRRMEGGRCLQGGARRRHPRRDRLDAGRDGAEHQGQAQGGHVGGPAPGVRRHRARGHARGLAAGGGGREHNARGGGLPRDEQVQRDAGRRGGLRGTPRKPSPRP